MSQLHVVAITINTQYAALFDKVLRVDAIQISKVPITRHIHSENNILEIKFTCTDIKLLRTVTNSMFDYILLILETIELHQ